MSTPEDQTQKPADLAPDEWWEAESNLGQALALLNRALARLDDIARAAEVQSGLHRAAAYVEAARAAHQRTVESGQVTVAGQARVPSATVAIIAAAIAAVLDRPYQILSLKPVPSPAPHVNVWALEGRTQIFQSHRIR